MTHPFLKQSSAHSTEVPAERVEKAPVGAAVDLARPSRILGVAAWGSAALITAVALRAMFTMAIHPAGLPAIPLSVQVPRIALVVRPSVPNIPVSMDWPNVAVVAVHAPAPKPEAAPRAVTPKVPPTQFANTKVLYRIGEEPSAVAKPTPAYSVASIISSDLVLISMQIDGQAMVSPYRVGQVLPDGRSITAIDKEKHQIETSRGVVTAP